MKWTVLMIVACTVLVAGAAPALAAEYFVSKQGSDENDGRSREAAFLTIQKGVDALKPGDTLTIGPGEYRESVTREGLGSAELDTTILAAIPGTVLLRGDVPAPEFTKLDGYRFIYVADFDGNAQAVNEVDTLKILETTPSVADLEFTPGGCYYDAEAKQLYISSSDMQPPNVHHYTVGVTPDHGLHLIKPTRVTIEGLAATGYSSAQQRDAPYGYRAAWGILVGHGNQSVIRHCTAYLNGGGIAFDNTPYGGGGGNLIEYCQAYGNYSRHSGEGGNIIAFSAHNDTIRHSYAHSTETQGIRLYGNITGPAISRHNLAWGNESADIWIKGGKASEFGLAEHNVALGELQVHESSHNLIGIKNKYNPEPSADNVRFAAESQMNQNEEFADPANLDFRLQATSRFRGAGPDGADRGPFPYEPNIFYVKSDGDDNADGLSVGNAWQSLDHALGELSAGDTLYLEAGIYSATVPVNIEADDAQAVRIRGRGTEPVIITGSLTVTGSSNISFERLNFTEPVQLTDGRAIRFNNCRFLAETTGLQAKNIDGLRITHGVFTGFTSAALQLTDGAEVFLSGNIFDNQQGPAVELDQADVILYADYNSYHNPDLAWRVNGASVALSDLPQPHGEHAQVLTPQFDADDGLLRLQSKSLVAGRGPHGTSLGIYHEHRKRDLRLEGPFVHSVTDTTVNLEWWSSVPARLEIAWGDTPECTNREKIEISQFASFSLTGLEPGRPYYFRILSAEPTRYADAMVTRGVEPSLSPLSFTTDQVPAEPVVYYVANDGDDKNSGQSRDQAWRTVRHAANRANAGDTVLIASGTYSEAIRVCATGKPGQPITFKAVPGERVVFDGNGRAILTAFQVTNKDHIHIDGFYFINYGKHRGEGGVISVNDSDHVQITRCFLNGKGAGYPNPFVYSTGKDLLVRNCVITNAFHGMLIHGPGSVRIEHNVFLRNMIQAILLTSGDAEVHHNIFVDSKASKVTVPLLSGPFSTLDRYVFEDNAFYLRQRDEQREPFVFYKDRSSYGYGSPERFSVAEYEQVTGHTGNIVRDPRFQITVGEEPTDREGNKVKYLGDWVYGQVGDGFDFPDLFTTHPELIEHGIGLVPEDFQDFHFNTEKHETAVDE